MATATLTYNLEDPDDRMAHLRAIKSTDMAIALFEITSNLKKKCRSIAEDEKQKLNAYSAMNEVFKGISEILEEQGIKIDELIN
jgi:hypothetical protein